MVDKEEEVGAMVATRGQIQYRVRLWQLPVDKFMYRVRLWQLPVARFSRVRLWQLPMARFSIWGAPMAATRGQIHV